MYLTSALGPLLFFIYINDFVNFDSKAAFHLFADGTALFYTNKFTKQLEADINIPRKYWKLIKG